MNHKILKLGAATAISVTGLNVLSSLKPVQASTYKTAIKRVKISYLPGKGVKIWTSYNSGRFLGYQAKDGTEWNVVKTAVDKHGKLWYMVGDNEWIEARYTVEVDEKDSNKTDNKKTEKTKKKEEKVNTAKKIVNKTINKTSKKTKPVSQAPSNVDAVVNLAKQQVGKKYVWGAEGPDTFDCSGLVQYVYQKAAGKSLPRTTYDQVNAGQTVALNALKKGDLVFWGSETQPYHVAIYIGNNQIVNAATPEQGVILQTLSSYWQPVTAKRVL